MMERDAIQLMDFSGQKILIMGASSGIGAETARLLSELGALTILVARREVQLAEVAGSLHGEGHRYYSADLGEIEQIEPLIRMIVEQNGPLDGYVNCVGIGDIRPLRQSNYEFMRHVMDVNFFSFIETMRCLTRRGSISDKFCVVTVSSASALRGAKAGTAYSASKGAMNAAVRCLARELAPRGIRVNAIMPGVTDTRLAEQSLALWPENSALASQPMGMEKPRDVALAAAFMLSDMAGMITGTAMSVDGGCLA